MKEKMEKKARDVSLDSFERGLRNEFNSCIDQLSRNFMKSPEWWVSGIASRDTYGCKLYLNIVDFLFACEKIRCSTETVTVEKPLIARLIRKQFPKEKSRVVVSRSTNKKYFKQFIKTVFTYQYVVIRFIVQLIASRLYSDKKIKLPSAPIVLVDMFLFANSFNESGAYRDRYYGDLKKYLDKKYAENFFYIPTRLDSLKSAFALTKKIRNSSDRFILQEDVLLLRDYIWAFLYPLRAFKFFPKKSKPIIIRDTDITVLFQRSWYEDILRGRSISGLLKYRIARRLREKGAKLKLVVDWFENQSIDKGFNMGIRESFPGTPVIGYQGFIVPSFFLCMNPSQAEYEAKVLPTEVAVCGPSFIEERRKRCPQLNVYSAPAFRFQQVYNAPVKLPDEKRLTILVALHLTVENAKDVLTLIAKVDWKSFSKPVQVIIKPHPCMKNYFAHIKNAGIEYGNLYKVNTGDFASALDESDIFISNTSSTCLEALAKGKAVLIVGSQRGSVTQNPIPDDVNKDFWAVVNSVNDITKELNRFLKTKAGLSEELVASYKDRFFAKVTKTACNQFLKIE